MIDPLTAVSIGTSLIGALGGGGGGGTHTQTQAQSYNPWGPAADDLKFALTENRRLYDEGAPHFFPHQTYANFDPRQLEAFGAISDRARMGNPLVPAAQGLNLNTINGDFLGPNPYFRQTFDAAARPVIEQFQNQIAPGIDASFSRAGRYGSRAYAEARNTAEDTLGRNLSELAGGLAFDNYNRERQFQNQGLTLAGNLAQLDYIDPQMLAEVGGLFQGQDQLGINEAIARHDFAYQAPRQHLGLFADFANNIGGNFKQAEGKTQTPTYGPDPLSRGLGLGLQTYNFGKQLGFGAPGNKAASVTARTRGGTPINSRAYTGYGFTRGR